MHIDLCDKTSYLISIYIVSMYTVSMFYNNPSIKYLYSIYVCILIYVIKTTYLISIYIVSMHTVSIFYLCILYLCAITIYLLSFPYRQQFYCVNVFLGDLFRFNLFIYLSMFLFRAKRGNLSHHGVIVYTNRAR